MENPHATLPIQFLFPYIIDMRLRCKSQGIGYPAGVPTDANSMQFIMRSCIFVLNVVYTRELWWLNISCIQEEWRIHMLPIQFLFLTVLPVIDMRLQCKSQGIGYPPGVPTDVSKVLELDIVSIFGKLHHSFSHWILVSSKLDAENNLLHIILQIRWELQGLDDMLKPSQFSLGVKGALYPDRRGLRSRLKGQLQLSISFVLPPVLALVPEHVRQDVAESVRFSPPLCFFLFVLPKRIPIPAKSFWPTFL